MKRSLVASGFVLSVLAVAACKKETPQSGAKSETQFSRTDVSDLLSYKNDYTEAQFETAYNQLFAAGHLFEGFKCKVRKIAKFRDATKPELAPFQKLADSELVGIDTYTGFAYTKINPPLRIIKANSDRLKEDDAKPADQRMKAAERQRLQGEIETAYKDIEPWVLVVKAASSGLNKLPKYEKKVVRGTRLRDEFVKGYCEKLCSGDEASCKIATEASFMSTTANDDVPPAFQGNAKFTVMGTSGRHIAAISQFPQENEVLFVPGADFVVKAIRFPPGKSCADFGAAAPAATGNAAPSGAAPVSETFNPSGSGTVTDSSEATTGPALHLQDNPPKDPNDCPDFVASAAQTPQVQLAQTSIGEALLGTSELPPGLASTPDTGIALTGFQLLDASTIEIDLKEVSR